jgi:hypothetical protein
MMTMGRLASTDRPFDLTIERYKSIINLARENGYVFYTTQQFFDAGCPSKGAFLIRHDLDLKPKTLWPILDAERECNVRSTTYVRVTANEYNAFSYHVLPKLLEAERDGFEIGLHTNFVEFAKINNLDTFGVVKRETNMLRQFFNVTGIAAHRDFNYIYNSLPWIRENWDLLSSPGEGCGFSYEAYDNRIEGGTTYVNDSFASHLHWKTSPYDAIKIGKSICFSTHPHWWYVNHPFEE